ncbi:hypothetical protein SAY86_030830 [Trapa natans]|uniref:Chalcone isomerase domain-containing protein n=1 Tax=Trapa natans TaxID=22666 RepID=A0AAN7M4D1_TRANT|nr:hypothetical protein SAY86_030830 [Trapa natans]
MKNNELRFKQLERRPALVLPTEPFVLHNIGGHICSSIGSLAEKSLDKSRNLHLPGIIALQESFNCMSRFTSTVVLWFTGGVGSSMDHNMDKNMCSLKPGRRKFPLIVRHVTSGTKVKENDHPALLKKISSFMMKQLYREADKLRSLPFLSMSAVKIPPLNNLKSCEVGKRGRAGAFFPDLKWNSHKVEPHTGIEFPIVLPSIFNETRNPDPASEILVGTGSRTMRIVKIKSLKVYAFGFYIHPGAVCEKIGPKYASLPTSEIDKCSSLYDDLLSEDISMTVRLVVNCNGLRINTVKDAFEKSLRARLLKTNPHTDYACLSKFRSIFVRDIPIPAGTTIDFHRTSDWNLITEIGGNKIGSVQSRELCRAFFDMYVGDLPVSTQTKEEIGKNVAGIIRRC